MPRPTLMTVDELEKFPDDGVKRWLLKGELKEDGLTVHDWRHASTSSRISYQLHRWIAESPPPRGEVFVGEAGWLIQRGPDTNVGIDVVYLSGTDFANQPKNATYLLTRPTLVVEVLSPSDTQERIDEKIEAYLAAGVPLVWVAQPQHRTITVYRPDQEPKLFNVLEELTAEPHLPGFRAAVRELFAE